LIASVNKENLPKGMQCKPFGKCSRRSIISTIGILFTEVRLHQSDRTFYSSQPDLKPENLLYLTKKEDSALVLADFGIAKTIQNDELLTTMAGSFGYAAPEVMLRQGHGKAVDMWSLGVITYTLLCGYSPFRSESMTDLIEECRNEKVIFHQRYWGSVSDDAKDFIKKLLKANPALRPTSDVRLSTPTGFTY
jgi:calcium/calmodulin-dependent protein kinase I